MSVHAFAAIAARIATESVAAPATAGSVKLPSLGITAKTLTATDCLTVFNGIKSGTFDNVSEIRLLRDGLIKVYRPSFGAQKVRKGFTLSPFAMLEKLLREIPLD